MSGIVHLPTGAGKTRVALQFIAQTLRADPDHRFIWATDSKILIPQTMKSAAALAALFPTGTTMSWYEGRSAGDGYLALGDERVHLTFVTRWHLRDELAFAHQDQPPHGWPSRVLTGKPLTVIYDECHQLGAEGLQDGLNAFYKKVVDPVGGHHRWRIIGLSATPVPTRAASHELLQKRIFPLRKEQPSAVQEWGMHVFHQVTTNELIRSGVLCRVSTAFDDQGIFDIPRELLRKVMGDVHMDGPPRDADRQEVTKYALGFNRQVMGNPEILRFLAERLANNFERLLGKTIVFVPDVAAANRLVEYLDAYPNVRGRAAAVHSKMNELRPPHGQRARTPTDVLQAYLPAVPRRDAAPMPWLRRAAARRGT